MQKMAVRLPCVLLCLCCLLLLWRRTTDTTTVILQQQATTALELFGIASDWPSRSLGNHRARLQLDGGGLAWARIEWRLPGLRMQDRTPVLIDERTGARVRNLYVVSATSEAAEIIFETKESRESGSTRQSRPAGGRPPRRHDSYSYEDDGGRRRRVSSWQPRQEPGCGCTGQKNAHGFGAFCKAWEEGLDPNQTPWCYVGDGCAAKDVRRGSFGKKHIDCAPRCVET